ncbi:MAG: hypothetical protein OEP95_06585 [Myxococcales bacterium]|nr:hypothetical protein [Myxococcales bacterium]
MQKVVMFEDAGSSDGTFVGPGLCQTSGVPIRVRLDRVNGDEALAARGMS